VISPSEPWHATSFCRRDEYIGDDRTQPLVGRIAVKTFVPIEHHVVGIEAFRLCKHRGHAAFHESIIMVIPSVAAIAASGVARIDAG
jgi:hypothetical protein